MKHVRLLSKPIPMPGHVQQGPFLSVLEIALNVLMKRLQDKKAEKQAAE
ncbi:MAG: hypothetical protein IT364_01065 [Candidatus Hydrogenedentes bacterium]|nr:hypothetical protein [Candidatus Hydrogenedentota bacterium]